MRPNHLKAGAAALAVLLLVFLWWGGREATTPLKGTEPVALEEQEPQRRSAHSHAHQHAGRDECASCPDVPKPDLEEMKRSGITAEQYVEMRREIQYAAADRFGGCYGLLLKAALDGDPNPNTAGLGGCDGSTPLHIANTPEQIQGLLDAGADVNSQDDFGDTPLHKQASMYEPTEENLEMVDLLLEAGADAQIKNQSAEAPWKTARLMSSTEIAHLTSYEQAEEAAAEQGVSLEAYLDANPKRKARLDGFLQAYLFEAKIKTVLLRAAVDPERGAALDER